MRLPLELNPASGPAPDATIRGGLETLPSPPDIPEPDFMNIQTKCQLRRTSLGQGTWTVEE